MVNSASQSEQLRRSRGSCRLPSSPYGATVVALTLFLLGLVLFTSLGRDYVVRSELAFRSVHAQSDTEQSDPGAAPTDDRFDAQSYRGRLPKISLQQIANAVRAVQRRSDRSGERSESVELSQRQLREIARCIEIEPLGFRQGCHHVAIVYRGRELRWSLDLVNELARQVIERYAASTPPPQMPPEVFRATRWRLDAARHYERKARFDMESALSSYLEIITDPAQRNWSQRQVAQIQRATEFPTGDTKNLPQDSPIGAMGVAPSRNSNPPHPGSENGLEPASTDAGLQRRRERLLDQQTELRDQLTKLLGTVTSEHPQARQLAFEIEQLQNELDSLPLHRETPAQHISALPTDRQGVPQDEQQWDADPAGFVSGDMASDHPLQKELSSFRTSRDYYETVAQQREAAEDDLLELVASQPLSARRALTPEVTRPATLMRGPETRPSAATLLAIGSLALICGGAIYWRIRKEEENTRINTLGELETVLGLPVLGHISLEPIADDGKRRRHSIDLVTWCIRGHEWALAIMIVLFLISVVGESAAASELINNPLGSFVHRVAVAIGR